ncbi:Chondroitin sulfate synthase 1 [Holothuria leucospilota]|uniref:Hexosyltransferase n=1 Tax=Holothuria leucospilota TaxID=206669 RepID=A0A9Q1H2B7_HOLLE|nr:Chondroitin sulfate synthase 1 [Holothuria leucospilota]
MFLRRSSVPGFRYVAVLLIGIALGFTLATWILQHIGHGGPIFNAKRCTQADTREDGITSTTVDSVSSRNLIFIGVMTAAKYLPTRAVAVNRTWAQTIPGQVAFFSSGASEVPAEWNLPVVSLQGVDDSYPPQKKSFMMLKYIHDNYIDKYEWFMRADDDVYIKGYKLEPFLRSINGSQKLFLGQAGLGKAEELGLLHLQHGDNFCMGGPGMVFSRETLRSIAPHISYCLKNLWSTHEDVEIGRCVRKFAGVDCTWSYEMQTLFYQNYSSGDLPFTGNLHRPEVWKAITLHPIKRTPHMYRLHAYLESQYMARKRLQILNYYREIQDMKELLHEDRTQSSGNFDHETQQLGLHPSLMKFRAGSFEDVTPWKFFSRYLYLHNMDSPRQGFTKPIQAAVTDVVLQIMQLINSNSKRVGRTIEFKEIMYGYSRVIPPYGVDYILDLLLTYKKHQGSSRALSVRRHTYLHQSFGRIELIEDELLTNDVETQVEESNSIVSQNAFTSLVSFQDNTFHKKSQETIYFIMPLAGRLDTFLRFMKNFEKTCLIPGDSVKLLVVLFRLPENDQSAEIEESLMKYKKQYPSYDLRLLHGVGDFKRGLALDLGASQFPKSALLFFVDVDMYLSPGFLSRCRLNTQLGSQVYFPSVFSQYNPDFVYGPQSHPSSQLVISKEAGFFRNYGYGIVCLYNGDLQRVGGMDSSIVGWGFEDVDLYQKFVSSNISIFRAPDPGLVHIYHSVECDSSLEPKQYQMCLGTKGNTYGSNMQLAKQLQELRSKLGGETKEIEEE